jgi:hypothetical protein
MTVENRGHKPWDGKSRLKTAVLVDVDGTLAGVYRNGKRPLRSSAPDALKMLSAHAPVFLWSIVGAENGERLLGEFPQIARYVSGCWAKENFPMDKVEKIYCIDDQLVDEQVVNAENVFLVDCYEGGGDSDMLMEAARAVVRLLRQGWKK